MKTMLIMPSKITSIIATAKEIELSLHLPNDVFKPSFMTTELTRSISQVNGLKEGSRILDLGTGCGIIAISMYLVGFNNIYVSDKFLASINAAKLNFAKYGFEPKKIYCTDMFEGIDEKFDLIVTNPPAFPTNPKLKLNEGMDGSVYSGPDGRGFIKAFLATVKDHLTENGRFLMTAPSFLDWNKIDNLLLEYGFDYRYNISDKCVLPTYGYPVKLFTDNFEKTFLSDYYEDRDSLRHHWKNFDRKIEYKVKTICGWAK